MHKTGSTTVQKSPNLRRTFRTRGRQTTIIFDSIMNLKILLDILTNIIVDQN